MVNNIVKCNENNLKHLEQLQQRLWPLCEKISNQLRCKELATRTITIKLKTNNFKSITRSRTLQQPTQLAEIIYQEAKLLLISEVDGRSFRLIGIGVRHFSGPREADQTDLLDNKLRKISEIEGVMETVRTKFGHPSIRKGRALLKY